MDDDDVKDDPPRGLSSYAYHQPDRTPTGRHRPLPVEPDPEPAHDVPAAPRPQPRTVPENSGGKFADRLGQSIYVLCLTYLAANDKIPGTWVVYAGGGIVGGVELLRALTRIRLVGVRAASGGLGVLLVMALGSPTVIGAGALALAATLLGWQRHA